MHSVMNASVSGVPGIQVKIDNLRGEKVSEQTQQKISSPLFQKEKGRSKNLEEKGGKMEGNRGDEIFLSGLLGNFLPSQIVNLYLDSRNASASV